jgi:pyruvate ferredoxin oxidoreductase gamma subunit
MKEIRIHGRGGQGVKTVAKIIGRATHLTGYCVQDFALYGGERRGAPLVSFVRFDREPIMQRGYIYEPNLILIVDPTVPMEPCLSGRRDDTPVLINSPTAREEMLALDATDIALTTLERPTPNTTMAGAAVHFIPEITLESLIEGIDREMSERFPPHIVQRNQEAAQKGYEATRSVLPAYQMSANA